jgi:hypothetical protein
MDNQLEEALKMLGIPADSDDERVTRAYRRLARATHPDVSAEPDAAERFAEVTAAFHLVSAAVRHSGPPSVRTNNSSDSPLRRSAPPPRPDLSGYVPAEGAPAQDWSTTRSDLPFAVSPDLPAASRGRPPIVAGPVRVRRARGDGGAKKA